MSLPIAQQKTVEVVFTGEVDAGGSNSEKVQNVFHFRRTAFVRNIDKAAVYVACKAAIIDKIILAQSARFTAQKVEIRCIDDKYDPYLKTAFTDPGAVAGPALPTNLAAMFECKTALRGRDTRGRKFFGPFVEAHTTDDVWNATGLTLLGAIKTGLLAGFTDSTGDVWKYCIVSKSRGDMTAIPAVYWMNDVTEINIQPRVAQLSGRRVKSV